MKRKRLTRESWGFQHFPYFQMRIDREDFHGLACVLLLTSGHDCCWHMPRAGRFTVAGRGMTWLQLIPDGTHHVLTAKFNPRGRINVWYADVVDRVEFDEDGVAAFVDMYLDVIFSPKGDLKMDDRDELDAALAAGDISPAQHALALQEGEAIQRTLCDNLRRTERWCRSLLQECKARMTAPDTLRRNV